LNDSLHLTTSNRIKAYWYIGLILIYCVLCGGIVQRLLAPREAANILGISYPTLKQWIYRGKLKTAKTPGGHHRVPESEIDRMIPKKLERGDIILRRGQFRKISGRNQLIGRVVAIKYSGILAQVTMAIGEQHITSIITADAAKEMRLKVGERVAALIKSTEVMILRV
jgi:molybdopterin-binding protein